MNDRIIQALKVLKENQDEINKFKDDLVKSLNEIKNNSDKSKEDIKKEISSLESKLQNIIESQIKKDDFNLQKLMISLSAELERWSIINGEWCYNGKPVGVRAEGKDGKDGKQGIQGPEGKQGKQGPQGNPGKDGKDGKQGPQGNPGKDGDVPEIRIGNVETSEEHGGAKAKLRRKKGTNTYLLDLTLPRGPQGFPGFDGKPGKDGTVPFEVLEEIQKLLDLIQTDGSGDMFLSDDGTYKEIQGGTGGTLNYEKLNNQPSVNNVKLIGNKTLEELGIQPKGEYITNAVNNLINYYLKTEVYSKVEVNTLIGNISTINIEVVQELPTIGQTNVIYLLPKEESSNDIYNEYIYINNNWEIIGTTQIDLTGYAKEDWVNIQIKDFLNEAQVNGLITTTLSNYYTKEEIDRLLKNKANSSDIPIKLSELENDEKYITQDYVDNLIGEINTELSNLTTVGGVE